jgi:hypothetical protein
LRESGLLDESGLSEQRFHPQPFARLPSFDVFGRHVIDRSSTPARFLLMWLISRRWVGFRFEQPDD